MCIKPYGYSETSERTTLGYEINFVAQVYKQGQYVIICPHQRTNLLYMFEIHFYTLLMCTFSHSHMPGKSYECTCFSF